LSIIHLIHICFVYFLIVAAAIQTHSRMIQMTIKVIFMIRNNMNNLADDMSV